MELPKVFLEKVNRIKAGYSSFIEKELLSIIKKCLHKEGIAFTENETEAGSWIIPVNKK